MITLKEIVAAWGLREPKPASGSCVKCSHRALHSVSMKPSVQAQYTPEVRALVAAAVGAGRQVQPAVGRADQVAAAVVQVGAAQALQVFAIAFFGALGRIQ